MSVDLNDNDEAPTQVLGYDLEESEAVGSVLETAAREDDVSPADPPYDTLVEWVWPAPAGDRSDDDDAGSEGAEQDEKVGLHVVPDAEDPEPSIDVLIDVLGPFQIGGNHHGAKVQQRSGIKELVVLLALHRPGYTAAQIKTFVWPKRPPADSTFDSTVSVARAWLRRVEGENLIPRRAVGGGMPRYFFEACVGTTWDLFQ